jgi:hypothetical protein
MKKLTIGQVFNWAEEGTGLIGMIRRTFHILVIAVLALNLMGAWALASITDCGMECCKPSELAGTGVDYYDAPSCCDYDGVQCGFEAGQVDELFDEAVCCFNSATSNQLSAVAITSSGDAYALTEPRTYGRTLYDLTPPPLETPLYLSNAAFLC